MRSIRSMIGMPVLCGGKRIGHVTHVSLNGEKTSLDSIYLSGGITGERKIDRADIELLGEVSILVKARGERKRHPHEPICRMLLPDGSRVGAVTGALLSEETLRVVALEMSRGYLDDLIRGRKWVLHYTVGLTGRDVLVMPEGGVGQ